MMISMKFLTVLLIIVIAIINIMIVILCFILSSKSRTKSDYDKNIEDDEQMNYLKEK